MGVWWTGVRKKGQGIEQRRGGRGGGGKASYSSFRPVYGVVERPFLHPLASCDTGSNRSFEFDS